MVAQGPDVVAGGKILDDLDVGDEGGPGVDSLEQIVAEHGGFGDAPRQSRLEGIDVIDALAGVGALAEQVLVHVGNRCCVRVDARGAGEHPQEQ